MRQAMMDAIRSRKRAKRQVPTIFIESEGENGGIDVEALDAALSRLEVVSPDLAQIVEMRFFVGLKPDEIALVLGSSESTIKRRWQTARLWLASELADV
jgi:RNA polymerase sigma factor (sigma-70 family)